MPGFSLQIVADTVTAKLTKAPRLIRQAVLDELETAGMEMESDARQIVPVDTGYLQNTIYHKVDVATLLLELGATADYAFFR